MMRQTKQTMMYVLAQGFDDYMLNELLVFAVLGIFH